MTVGTTRKDRAQRRPAPLRATPKGRTGFGRRGREERTSPGGDGQTPAGDAAPSVAWRHVELRGRQVLYGEAGDGPSVLFLHGWGLHARAYRHALVRLAAVPVHFVAPALPGFGGKAALGGSEWSLGGFGAWVSEFLDVAGIH